MHHHAAYVGSKRFMEISMNGALDVNSFLFIGTIFFRLITT